MRLVVVLIFFCSMAEGLDNNEEPPPVEEIALREGRKRKNPAVMVKRLSRALIDTKDKRKRKNSAPNLGTMERVKVIRSQTHEKSKSAKIPVPVTSFTPPAPPRRGGIVTVNDYYKEHLSPVHHWFVGKNFSHSTFVFCECSDVSFKGLNLTQAVFNHASLMNTDFTNTNLTEASFIGATLVNANLTSANIEKADFQKADLRNAHIVGEHGTIRLIDKNYLDARKATYDEQTKFGLYIN